MTRFIAGLVLSALIAAPIWAQDPGVVEDVPYLATPQIVVDEMLRIAQVTSADTVYDLGSGDGRVLITAARKFGARAVGVEIDPKMVALSRANVSRAGVAQRVKVLQQDIFATDLREASVVTLYLAPHLNLRLRDTLLGLAAGTRIVSHSADLGDWKPDRRIALRKDLLLWVVPARVAGRWQARVGESVLELDFEQRFQELTAQARLQGEAASVWEIALRGDELRFVVVDARAEASYYFSGRVRGDAIEGEVSRDVGTARSAAPWRAARR